MTPGFSSFRFVELARVELHVRCASESREFGVCKASEGGKQEASHGPGVWIPEGKRDGRVTKTRPSTWKQ